MTGAQAKRFTKKERSWILYDWANSVYATNIMAAIFPTLFVAIAGDGGDRWWGYGTSLATLLMAVSAPLLGSIADYKGMKKRLFTTFMLLGVLATASIAITGDWRVMLACYVVSHVGFSGANLFYDSFLTDVTTNERMDKVSTWGFAMGYIGGSTIPFVASIAVLMLLGYSNPIAQKFSILITSVWWLAFSIPFLRNVEQEHFIQRPKRLTPGVAFGNTLRTAREIVANKGLLLFVLAYFFYIDGVGTIISISTAYGTALGLGATGMILALLVTQLVGMPSSILFGKLARRISARRALLIAICVYLFICLVGFYMGYSLEPHQDAYRGALAQREAALEESLAATFEDPDAAEDILNDYAASARAAMLAGTFTPGALPEMDVSNLSAADATAALTARQAHDALLVDFTAQNAQTLTRYRDAIRFSTTLFWAMAILVGTMQGGIQAISRSYYGKLIPKERSSEFFGFFDIFGKFATVIGPFLYALVGGLTGRSSFGALCLSGLFLAGFLILLLGRRHLQRLEEQTAPEA